MQAVLCYAMLLYSSTVVYDAMLQARLRSLADALRAAAPFPPMADPVRGLAQVPILATFTNPTGG